jgi:hypothetical protein
MLAEMGLDPPLASAHGLLEGCTRTCSAGAEACKLSDCNLSSQHFRAIISSSLIVAAVTATQHA